jgi:hypothetical protein
MTRIEELNGWQHGDLEKAGWKNLAKQNTFN